MKNLDLTVKEWKELPTGVRIPAYAVLEYDWRNGTREEVSQWKNKRIRLGWPVDDLARPVEVGSVFTLGNYRLRIVQANGLETDDVFVMSDGWRSILYWRWSKITTIARWVNVRLIITARVWGLAKPDSSRTAVPSWSELHVYKWLKRTLQPRGAE